MSQTLFERLIAGEIPASFVHQDAVCVAFMDINPMSPGHVLVVPRQAVKTLAELDAATRAHLMEVAVRIGHVQRRVLGSQAQHVLVNDGPGASQTVPHVHVHVIPRYRGDALRTLGHILRHVTTMALRRTASPAKRALLQDQAGRLGAVLREAHPTASG